MANSGGLEPDTAASAAAVNQSPGVPIVPEQWGEIPYFLRKSRQNAGIDLNLKCRDALPAPLPARIAELGFAVYIRFFAADGGGTALQPFPTRCYVQIVPFESERRRYQILCVGNDRVSFRAQ